MVLGALTHSHFAVNHPLLSEDCIATLDALHSMGAEVRSVHSGMQIFCEELAPPHSTIDAKNSGTTIRLMTGLAALLKSTTTLTGDDSLVKRPMGPLVDALQQLGAKCSYLGAKGNPPLSVSGPIIGERTEIVGDVSSQFVSSLLIACSQKKGDTSIVVRGELRSRPYVDITLQMLREFGGTADEGPEGFMVPGEQKLERDTYEVPGDYSSAAFPLAAAAITGGEVAVRNLDAASPQGDRQIVDLLGSFGAHVHGDGDQVVIRGGRLSGKEIDVRDTPDLFPILAVIGSLAEGRTVLKGGENLRAKESDRIEATTRFLHDMGATIRPTPDGCEISGVEKLHGAVVRTEGDHRIFMAAVVAGLAASSETRIEEHESFKVSYPGFLRDMHQLGCRVEVRK